MNISLPQKQRKSGEFLNGAYKNCAKKTEYRVLQNSVVLVAVLASIVYSYYVTRPVLRISNVSKRMAELDFSWRCEENRTDELGTLARSLNEMSQKLMES